MKTNILAFIAVSFVAIPMIVRAQADATPKPIVLSQTHSVKATVEDIDYDKRELTLKGPEGRSEEFHVSEQVKNFPQIKKGDEVKVDYYESIALALSKPGEAAPAASSHEALVTSEPGEKPGASAVTVSDITATVEKIDREKREVTLKGPRGNLVTVKVDPSVGNLKRIKEGDTIRATHTEALAVAVETPQKK